MGSYDAYAVPRRGFITKVERESDRIRLFGDIELVQKHMRSYDIVRQPLQSVAADALKRAAPECRYVVLGRRGARGAGRAGGRSPMPSFLIDLGGKLPAGQFTLLAEIVVNGNAMNAEIKRIPIVMPSAP